VEKNHAMVGDQKQREEKKTRSEEAKNPAECIALSGLQTVPA